MNGDHLTNASTNGKSDLSPETKPDCNLFILSIDRSRMQEDLKNFVRLQIGMGKRARRRVN
jgi:hypothetical protein